MEFQIVLLPRTDYWTWLRACRDYVMAFGGGLTDDPGTAARYMAPRQVITLPNRRDAFPEIGDAERWFQTRHPGIRLDVVDADTPKRMGRELAQRVAENDRYGAKRRPFYLLWPTDFPVVTQSFGVNPQIYRRYGMPGHEGVDMRALTNTNVYACADGDVYEVHTKPNDHAYGIHVRLQHRDGYKTIYAHLARALVAMGDRLKAGDLVGRADSTGNSSAAHLHLSLKRDGATARKETSYPKDIIDPTPFLVWPAQGQSHSKVLSTPSWAGDRCLVGVRLARGGSLEPADLEALRVGRVEALLVGQEAGGEVIDRARAVHPGLLVVARLELERQDEDATAEGFAQKVEADVRRLTGAGVLDFEVHSEPNLTERGLGWAWAGGAEFGRWFLEVVRRLRSALPEARFGFPMLSPGDGILGKRQSLTDFVAESEEAMTASDWLGVACYWNSAAGIDLPTEGRAYEMYRSLFPEKLILLTGLGPCEAGLPPREAARQATQFLERARGVPGLAAAFAGVTTPTTTADGEPLIWRSEGGEPAELARALGRRTF
jgi:hypothetical protein